MTPLAQEIEQYLMTSGRWVSTEEICAHFNLRDDRPLRQMSNEPGLCSEFAISSDQGFKHVALASTGEWLRFKHRLRRHGIRELARASSLDKRRHQVTRPALGLTWEKDSGQAVMAL